MNCWLAASIFLTILGASRCVTREEEKQQMLQYGELVSEMLHSIDVWLQTTYQASYEENYRNWLNTDQLLTFSTETLNKLNSAVKGSMAGQSNVTKMLLAKLCGNMKKKGIWIVPYNENIEYLYVNVVGGNKAQFERDCNGFYRREEGQPSNAPNN